MSLLIFYIGDWRDFKELQPHGRSCLIGQISAKRFPAQVSSRDIVAGLFFNKGGILDDYCSNIQPANAYREQFESMRAFDWADPSPKLN